MSNQYKELLEILSISDDTSHDKLKIASKSLAEEESQKKLKSFGVVVISELEGIRIELSEQKLFCIYKTKNDALTYCTEGSFDKDILIIEGGKIWTLNDQKDVFIENIKFWHNYKKILTDKVADYVNDVDKEFVLLSTDKGKIDIGFSKKPMECFDRPLKQATFDSIEKLINEHNDFISFFKNAFISTCAKKEKESRFSCAIDNIDILYEAASRDYGLYKNKFSFKEFNKGLEHSKEKYLKDYQLFLSSFLEKIANLPIQIGVYLFLIYRFSEVTLVLVLLIVLIIVWLIYTCRVISIMSSNAKEIKTNFDKSIDLIKEKSGLDDDGFSLAKEQIASKFDSLSSLLNSYKYINIISSSLFIVIILYYLSCTVVIDI